MLFNTTGTGRLVADAEVKFTNEKSQLLEIRIATNERVKKGDNWEDRPSYLTLKYWVHANSKLPQYLKKGTQVVVNGKVEEERWETDGQKRSKVVVIVTDLELVGGKSDVANAAPTTPASQAPASTPAPAETGAPIDEDEIPF